MGQNYNVFQASHLQFSNYLLTSEAFEDQLYDIAMMDKSADIKVEEYHKSLFSRNGSDGSAKQTFPYNSSGPMKETIVYDRAVDIQFPHTQEKDKKRAHYLQGLYRKYLNTGDKKNKIGWQHCQRVGECRTDGDCRKPWSLRRANFMERVKAINEDPDLPWRDRYECCNDFMLETLLAYTSALKAGGGEEEFFISYGTLIGALRDRDIMPFTADVDVVVHEDFYNTVLNNRKLTDALNDRGYILFDFVIHRACRAAHVERTYMHVVSYKESVIEMCGDKTSRQTPWPWHDYGWLPYQDAHPLKISRRHSSLNISSEKSGLSSVLNSTNATNTGSKSISHTPDVVTYFKDSVATTTTKGKTKVL